MFPIKDLKELLETPAMTAIAKGIGPFLALVIAAFLIYPVVYQVPGKLDSLTEEIHDLNTTLKGNLNQIHRELIANLRKLDEEKK